MAASSSMQRAIDLAQKARHRTSPNPMVGAVLVKGGTVVGEGYHQRAGLAHAETAALLQAGRRARGAVLYVTLEPCAHHGLTPPCADALIAAGVARVVVAMKDPDRRTAGKGISRLRRAGIEVAVGDGASEAARLNPRYLASRRAGRPYVALKFAMSLDGKTAPVSRRSRWITGSVARGEAQRLRRVYDAVAVGARTVIDDDPELTARDRRDQPGPRQPLRIVLDGRLRVRPGSRMLSPELPGRAMVATSDRASAARRAPFEARGLTVRSFGRATVEPDALLTFLAREGVNSLLVEGGGEVAWSFVAAGVVDRVYAFIGPRILGGSRAPTPVGGQGFLELAEAARLEVVDVRRLGEDLLLEAVPVAG